MSEKPNTTAEPGSASVDPNSVEGLFVAALGKATAEERRAFLDDACGEDAEMRRRVEALLRAYDDAGSFLEKPAVDQPTTVAGDEEIRLDFLTPTDKSDRLGMLGHYEILEVIGRGGMGIVLRAQDPKLNRVVAIKALAPELAANPNARRRFTREAQHAASISHPHIVTIHAVEEEPWPFLVMECVAGQSLQEKLDRSGSLRLTEILRIGRQVAEGLSAAHRQGLIHRDIKPANILLENGVERVKITDFGLARAVDDVAITKTGEVHGTPQYMSPEQARGERVDQRSDLFSLGCVLYAMCSGRPPFRAESLAGVMNRVINDQPRPLLELNPEMPPWLIDFVATLLAKDPEERFQSADEVAELLGEHLANVQQPAGAARVRPRPHRVRRRHVVRDGQVPAWLTWTIPSVLLRGAVYCAIVMLALVAVMNGALNGTQVVLAAVIVPGVVWLAIWNSRRTGGAWGRLSYWDPVLASAAFVIGALTGFYDSRTFPQFNLPAFSASGAVLGLFVFVLCFLIGSRRHRIRTHSAHGPGGGIQRPATVLMWLAVAVVSLLLLAPCLILIPWYFAKSSPRPVAVDQPVVAPDPGAFEPMMLDQEGYHEAAVAPVATGALILDFQDRRLSVELRPLDIPWDNLSSDNMDDSLEAWDDLEGALERPGSVYHQGGTYELPVGYYRPVVHDRAFGWRDDTRDDATSMQGDFAGPTEEMYSAGIESMFGSPPRIVSATYTLPEIRIDEGAIATLTVTRDFSALAASEPDWSRGALYHFSWSGQEYLLTKPQAKMVNYLFWAFASGEREVSSARLWNAFESDEDKSLNESISVDVPDPFRWMFNDGAHPAWGSLIVTSEAGTTYRLTEPVSPGTAASETNIIGPPSIDLAPGVVLASEAEQPPIGPKLSVDVTPDAYAGDREALVTVDIRDTGLFVALRRKSSFSGEKIGEEENVSHIGPTVLRLPSGTYEVLLRDPMFGWGQDRIETVEVPNGAVQTFVVERDFSRYSYADDALAGLRNRFVWNGKAFALTPVQAICVNLLLRRYAEGAVMATGQELVANARDALKSLTFGEPDAWSERPPALEDIFQDMGTFDPGQTEETSGGLVLRVADTNEYRLAPAELSTIQVQIEHDGLTAVLSGERTHVTLSGMTAERLGVAPGQYTVTLYDHKVEWHSWEAGEVISSWTQPPVTIPRGETREIVFARDAEHFHRVADFEIPEQQKNISFIWFGREIHEERPGWQAVYPLSRDQVACIRALLRALADGNPEMTGEEIVVAAGLEGQTFEEVFAEYGSNFHSHREVAAGEEEPREPFEPWPGVIIRGERENTWRLSAPPAEMVSLDASLTQTSAPRDEPPDSDFGPTLTVNVEEGNQDKTGKTGVSVDIRDVGLIAGLRRLSEFSDDVVGEEQVFDTLGPRDRELPNGTYQVLIRDTMFGWQHDSIETVEIASGTNSTLIVERDFTRYAPSMDWKQIDFRKASESPWDFRWNGETYGLSMAQVQCVNLLLRRHASGIAETTAEDLLNSLVEAGFADKEDPAVVRGVLAGSRQSDTNLLDDLVVTGDERTYRLAAPQLAEVHVDIAHEGLTLVLSSSEASIEVTLLDDQRLGVAPGEYGVTLHDDKVKWQYLEGANFVTSRQIESDRTLSPMTLRAGETWEIEFARDGDHFHQVAAFDVPEQQERMYFIWFGREGHEERPGRGGVLYPLNRDQAACIRALLDALADGQPEMTGAEIVAAAGIERQSFEEAFEDFAARFRRHEEVPAGGEVPQEPFEPWPGVIIRGEREDSWRLSAPPAEMVSLEATPSENAGAGLLDDESNAQSPSRARTVTARHPTVPGESAPDSLDRLIALAAEEHQRVRQLFESGAASPGEVRDAEIRLLEVRIRRAKAVGDADGLAELLREIITLREARLAEAEELFRRGAVPAREVNSAREELLEARLQLAEGTAAGDELGTLLSELVTLKEEQLRRVERLIESGAGGEDELSSANASLIEARLRLATTREESDTVRELLDQLISIREAELERAQRLYEQGATSDLQIEAARSALLESKVRREELEAK